MRNTITELLPMNERQRQGQRQRQRQKDLLVCCEPQDPVDHSRLVRDCRTSRKWILATSRNQRFAFLLLTMAAPLPLIVLAPILPDTAELDDQGRPTLGDDDTKRDGYDIFNHPRFRRALILQQLNDRNKDNDDGVFCFQTPDYAAQRPRHSIENAFSSVHTPGLVSFLIESWKKWLDMGTEGRDMDHIPSGLDEGVVPNLVPGNCPLPRDPYQVPSDNVMGQVGYYCTDDCTVIFEGLLEELQDDTAMVAEAVELAMNANGDGVRTVYTIPTHPGHHAAKDSFGGYCYVNQAAQAVYRFKELLPYKTDHEYRVAILDVGEYNLETCKCLWHSNSSDWQLWRRPMLVSFYCYYSSLFPSPSRTIKLLDSHTCMRTHTWSCSHSRLSLWERDGIYFLQ